MKPGIGARKGYCGKVSGASWISSILCKSGALNASIGQSDWFLVSCNVATVGHGKYFEVLQFQDGRETYRMCQQEIANLVQGS